MPFQVSECYSPTSSQARVLVVQASIAAYLQDFPSRFFSYDSLNTRKWRNHYWRATYKDNFSPVLNQEFLFFGSRVAGFASNLSCLKYWLLRHLFLRGSHVQRQYRKRTTLCSESSTSKGLLYAPDPDNCKKGTLSDQPRLSRVSSTALLCCWGGSRSKIWCPYWLTLRCMSYGRGTLRILLWSICSKEGPHYCHERSARKLS
jgi:hypothetical protein